jgi:hypothetical protein
MFLYSFASAYGIPIYITRYTGSFFKSAGGAMDGV